VPGLTDRVQANPLVARRLGDYGNEGMAISVPGTLAGAGVILPTGEELLVFSAYSRWEKALDRKTIYADRE